MLACAHVGNDPTKATQVILGLYIQPLSVPEALSARGPQFRSGAYQKCPTRPGFVFYVKIGYAEQLLTSYENISFNQKTVKWLLYLYYHNMRKVCYTSSSHFCK